MAWTVIRKAAPDDTPYHGLVAAAAVRNGLDPELVLRQVKQESGFDPNAVNKRSGAAGLIQVMKATAGDPGYGVKPISDEQRFDPKANVEFGTSYLAALKRKYGSDKAALIAYNWGPGNYEKWSGNDADLPAETRDYVARILEGGGATPGSGTTQPQTVNGWTVVRKAATAGAPAVRGGGEVPAFAATAPDPFAAPTGPAMPTQEELDALLPLYGDALPLDVQLFMVGKGRGLDSDAATAYAEEILRAQETQRQAKLNALPPGERQDLMAKGRLATLMQGLTLNLGDDLVGLVDEEAAQEIRDVAETYSDENPVSALALTVLGALPLGAAARQAAPGLFRMEAATGVAPVARNVAKLAGEGAAYGGAAAAGAGEDPVTGAVVGGAAGPLAVGAARGIDAAARRILSSRSGHAIRLLAKRLGESPTALASRWEAFRAATGRAPSLVEVGSPTLAQEMRSVGQGQKAAEDILDMADRRASRLRPGQLSAGIRRGGPVANIGDEVAARKRAFDLQMQGGVDANGQQVRGIQNDPVELSLDEFEMLTEGDFARVAMSNPQIRRKVIAAREEMADYEKARAAAAKKKLPPPDPPEVVGGFTVRDMEGLRQGFRSAQEGHLNNGMGDVAVQYGRMADTVTGITAEQVPEYALALDEFGLRSRHIAGLRHGEAGKTIRDAEGQARVDLSTAEGAEGIRRGVRGRLSDAAISSERGAVRTAREMSEDADLAGVMRSTLGPDEAQRLQTLGRMESRAAANLDLAARGVAPTERQSMLDIAARGAEALGTGFTQATQAFKLRTAVRWLRNVGMGKDTARRVVLLTASPQRAAAALRALREQGLSDAQIREFYARLAAPAGAAAGSME